MNMFLTLVSGICWSIVYLELIRLGFKDKTYGMPLFALGLNLAWEAIYTYTTLIQEAYGPAGVQAVVNLVWLALDIIILVTYFKYGRKYFPKSLDQKYFVPGSILVLASCAVAQALFAIEFGTRVAPAYAAFIQNFIMSILFLALLFGREGTEGQSMVIAVAKWIGTLAPTMLFGGNPLVLGFGVMCSVFDIIYIVLLYQRSKLARQTSVSS